VGYSAEDLTRLENERVIRRHPGGSSTE
jgi:hypothetical protein